MHVDVGVGVGIPVCLYGLLSEEACCKEDKNVCACVCMYIWPFAWKKESW